MGGAPSLARVSADLAKGEQQRYRLASCAREERIEFGQIQVPRHKSGSVALSVGVLALPYLVSSVT